MPPQVHFCHFLTLFAPRTWQRFGGQRWRQAWIQPEWGPQICMGKRRTCLEKRIAPCPQIRDLHLWAHPSFNPSAFQPVRHPDAVIQCLRWDGTFKTSLRIWHVDILLDVSRCTLCKISWSIHASDNSKQMICCFLLTPGSMLFRGNYWFFIKRGERQVIK